MTRGAHARGGGQLVALRHRGGVGGWNACVRACGTHSDEGRG